jgi:hypothetical protein
VDDKRVVDEAFSEGFNTVNSSVEPELVRYFFQFHV